MTEWHGEFLEWLERHFSVEELRTLCFCLSVDYDGLPGEGKTAKARELLAHAKRHGCLEDLVNTAIEQRPNVRPPRNIPSDIQRIPKTSPEAKLCNKLRHLRALGDNCPLALVGSTYLDIILSPILTTELGRDEWTDLDTIDLRLGGSALLVAKYLLEFFDKKSHVFSIESKEKNNPLTSIFQQLVKQQPWLDGACFVPGGDDLHAAVTVHLVQPPGPDQFTTMFTNSEILAGLSWGAIRKKLYECLANGGVLYIAGYFKTHLHTNLIRCLKQLPSTTLVCVDHGRLVRRYANLTAAQRLHDAFENDYVDIYFCTFRELWRFCKPTSSTPVPQVSDPGEVKQNIEELAKIHPLPFITIVRDKWPPKGAAKAFARIGDEIHLIESDANSESIGSKSAFNATLMHYLIYGGKLDMNRPAVNRLQDLIIAGCELALEKWHEADW